MSSAQIPDEVAATLEALDPATQLGAIAEIALNPASSLSERTVYALARCVGAESKAVGRRAAEAAALVAAHDPRIAPAIRALLEESSPRARFGAAYALGLIGGAQFDLRAADALYQALGDADGDVRWAAHDLILRLGGAHPPQVRSGLLALARDGREDNGDARKMALYCLRDLGPESRDVLDAARAASTAADAHVRLASLAILARAPAYRREAAAIAMRMLETDPQPGVRRAAAAALGLIGELSLEVLEALGRAAARETDSALARAASAAITRLTGGLSDEPKSDRTPR
ncbi:MAG TPA: HEAT repeat domain-containing protein [Candidatus Binataceae bacterium]|nr:HEAT repeat domain-containing protein [Candidatus Binataceae bacterium]